MKLGLPRSRMSIMLNKGYEEESRARKQKEEEERKLKEQQSKFNSTSYWNRNSPTNVLDRIGNQSKIDSMIGAGNRDPIDFTERLGRLWDLGTGAFTAKPMNEVGYSKDPSITHGFAVIGDTGDKYITRRTDPATSKKWVETVPKSDVILGYPSNVSQPFGKSKLQSFIDDSQSNISEYQTRRSQAQKEFESQNVLSKMLQNAQQAGAKMIVGAPTKDFGGEFTSGNAVSDFVSETGGSLLGLGFNPGGSSLLSGGLKTSNAILGRLAPKAGSIVSKVTPEFVKNIVAKVPLSSIAAKFPKSANAAKNIAFTGAEGALTMAPISPYQSMMENKTVPEAGNKLLTDLGTGAAFGAGLGAAGQAFKAAKPSLFGRSYNETLQAVKNNNKSLPVSRPVSNVAETEIQQPKPIEPKKTHEMTKAEFDNYYGLDKDLTNASSQEVNQSIHGSTQKLLNDSGKRIIEKVGSSNLNDIANYYKSKYNLPEINVQYVDSIGKNENVLAQLSKTIYDSNGKPKSAMFKIKANESPEQTIASFRHELEHFIEKTQGYKSMPENANNVMFNQGEIKTPRSINEKYYQGHNKNYGWFEADYLRRAMVKDAIKSGEKVPQEVLQELGLTDYKPKSKVLPKPAENIKSKGDYSNIFKPVEIKREPIGTKTTTGSKINEAVSNSKEIKTTENIKPKYQTKLDEIKAKYEEEIKRANKFPLDDAMQQSKKLKGIAMKYAAEKRAIIQGDSLIPVDGGLTTIELNNKIKKLKSNYVGKEVLTPDGEGVITGSSFGRTGVKLKDGTVKYYEGEKIKPKFDVDAEISRQKSEIEARKIQPIQANKQTEQSQTKPIESPNVTNNIDDTLNDTITNTTKTVDTIDDTMTESKGMYQETVPEKNNVDTGSGVMKELSYTKTVKESPLTSKELADKIEKKYYETVVNKEQLEQSMNKIATKGIDDVKNEFMAKTHLNDSSDVMDAIAVMDKLDNAKRYDEATEVLYKLSTEAKTEGQKIQALSVWNRRSKEGFLSLAQKIKKSVYEESGGMKVAELKNMISKLESEMSNPDVKLNLKLYSEKAKKVKQLKSELDIFMRKLKKNKVSEKLTPEEYKAISENMDTFYDSSLSDNIRYEARDKAYKMIADLSPATLGEKYEAFRKMGMLANVVGRGWDLVSNVLRLGIRHADDKTASIMQKMFLSKGDRTLSLKNFGDKELANIVKADWDKVKYDLKNGGRWSIESPSFLGEYKTMFKTKSLQKSYDITNNVMSAIDYPFLKSAYKNSLYSYMKAKGIKEITKEARDFAIDKAMYATYRQTKKLGDLIGYAKRRGGFTGFAARATVPFHKTPTNILYQSIEHSPVGLASGLGSLAKKGLSKALKKGWDVKTGEQVINDISRGAVGTALMGIGVGLGTLGIANANVKLSNKGEKLQQLEGKNPYSIDTPWGNIQFDRAAPTSVPFFMGVAMSEAWNKGKNPYESFYKSLEAAGEVLSKQTILRNVQDIGGYEKDAMNFATNLFFDYFGASIPTAISSANKIIDNTKRDTTDSNDFIRFLKQQQAKIPFASKMLPPKLDITGKEIKQGEWYNQIIPGNFTPTKNHDNITQKLMSLYNRVEEKNKTLPDNYSKTEPLSVFAPELGKDFNYTDKKNIKIKAPDMSQQELVDMRKDFYKIVDEKIPQLFNDKLKDGKKIVKFNKVDDDKKINALKNLYDNAAKQARINALNKKGISTKEEDYVIPTTGLVEKGFKKPKK